MGRGRSNITPNISVARREFATSPAHIYMNTGKPILISNGSVLAWIAFDVNEMASMVDKPEAIVEHFKSVMAEYEKNKGMAR